MEVKEHRSFSFLTQDENENGSSTIYFNAAGQIWELFTNGNNVIRVVYTHVNTLDLSHFLCASLSANFDALAQDFPVTFRSL